MNVESYFVVTTFRVLLMVLSTTASEIRPGKHVTIGYHQENGEKHYSWDLYKLERSLRKLEAFQALRKTFEKVDHDVDMRDFFDTRTPSVEDMCNQIKMLQD